MFSKTPIEQSKILADRAAPLMDRASDQVSALAQRGMDSVRDTALHASDSTVNYVRDEPVKAMLIAAAAGAALMAIVSLLGRSRDRG